MCEDTATGAMSRYTDDEYRPRRRTPPSSPPRNDARTCSGGAVSPIPMQPQQQHCGDDVEAATTTGRSGTSSKCACSADHYDDRHKMYGWRRRLYSYAVRRKKRPLPHGAARTSTAPLTSFTPLSATFLLLFVTLIAAIPFAHKAYVAHQEWDNEWLEWEASTQRALMESLPEHVVAGASIDVTAEQRRRLNIGGVGVGVGVVESKATTSSSRMEDDTVLGTNQTSGLDFVELGKRRDALVKDARRAASATIGNVARYPPRADLSSASSSLSTTALSSSGGTIPVLGVAVHVDPHRFLPRLLFSIDSPVDAIVVTWYGDDGGVGDGIRSFLGDRFVPVVTDEDDGGTESSFDGDGIVSRFRLRQIADWDATAVSSSSSPAATDSSSSSSSSTTSPAVPCREFVVVRYSTNMGCAVGFNNPILLYPTAPYWMLVNYDVAYPPGVLANTAEMVDQSLREHPNLALHTFGLVYGRGDVANPWSNFAVTAKSIANVGLFDENLFPAYYEDDDYRDRVRQILGKRRGPNDFIQDDGVIVRRNDRSVAVVHGPIDAKKYVSGNDQVIKANPIAREQWKAYHAIARNGQYFQCKHGNSPRPHIFGYEYGPGDKYFTPSDRYDSPFGTTGQSWDEWTFNATRRECVYNGVGELVPLKGWRRWIKARELAEKCGVC